MTWLVGAYLVADLESIPPRKTALTISVGVVVLIVSGLVRKWLPPPRIQPPLLSRSHFFLLYRLLVAVGFVAIARLITPLIWRAAPLLGQKPSVSEALMWAAVLLVVPTVIHLAPLIAPAVVESAEDLLARDGRAPILYFRSFERELEKNGLGRFGMYQGLLRGDLSGVYLASASSVGYGGRSVVRNSFGTGRSLFDEQMVFATAFDTAGPYIALGRPTEDFRNMDLGAAKKYVENHEWRAVVHQWLSICQAVVIEAADSFGLAWELQEIVNGIPPDRILIICPRNDEQYDSFRGNAASMFPRPLPTRRPLSRLLSFSDDWTPVELEFVNSDAFETLRPFLQRLDGRAVSASADR